MQPFRNSIDNFTRFYDQEPAVLPEEDDPVEFYHPSPSPRHRHTRTGRSRYRRHQNPLTAFDPNNSPLATSLQVNPRSTRVLEVADDLHYSPVSMNNNIEPLPFSIAARRLNQTLTNAIEYFTKFQQEFQYTSETVTFHANHSLLNTIWRSQIEGSRRKPDHRFGEAAAKKLRNEQFQNQDGSGNDQTYQNQNYDPNYHDTSQQHQYLQYKESTAAKDLTTFPEHQSLILQRIEQFLISSGCSPVSHHSFNASSQPPAQPHSRNDAQSKLVGRVNMHYQELKTAVEGMSRDYLQARSAIRDLKGLKEDLGVYQEAWNEIAPAVVGDENEMKRKEREREREERRWRDI